VVTPPTLQIDRSLRRALRTFDRDRLRWFDEAAALGPLVALKLGPAKAWVVTDSDLARTVLVTEADRWVRPSSAVVPIRLAIGENLFTQSDEHWATIQPSLSPAFRKKTLNPRLAELPDLIAHHASTIRPGEVTDLEALTNRIALAVAARVLFDDHLDPGRADELAAHQQEVVSWIGERIGQVRSVVPFAIGARARAMRVHGAALDAYADEIISRARHTPPPVDGVLAALLAARPAGSPLSPQALRSHVLGLLFAGNETTAAALAWALVNGARNPAAWSALRADPLQATAFTAETLRLTPAVWSFARSSKARHATLATNEMTASVKRNEVVTIYLRGMNRNPSLWPEPASFRPDRHHEPTSDQQRSLLPFGLGPRSCIGQHLALAELHAALPVLSRVGDHIRLTDNPIENPRFALRFRSGLHGTFVAESHSPMPTA
jgi:cytochrome P450